MTRFLVILLLLSSSALACDSRNGLPDPVCSPGAVDPSVTQANLASTVCKRGYAKSVRPPLSVSSHLKRQVMRAYGIMGSMRDYEADHLVSLELGGDPTSTLNIWPEPWSGPEGAHAKDAVENQLHRLVCSGRMPLAEAQHRIASDWKRALDDQAEAP